MRNKTPFRAIAFVTSAYFHIRAARLHPHPRLESGSESFASAFAPSASFRIRTGTATAGFDGTTSRRPNDGPPVPYSRESSVFPSGRGIRTTSRSTTGRLPAADRPTAMTTVDDVDPMKRLGLPGPLILGSGSFTRKLLLGEMGVKYVLRVRSIDERGIGDRDGDPSALVMTLAEAKADRVVEDILSGWNATDGGAHDDGRGEGDGGDDDGEMYRNDRSLPFREEGYVVLTADQVVTHDGRILEKPDSIEEAKRFVSGYAASPPRTVGSCCLTHVPSGMRVAGVDSATIRFRNTVADADGDGRDLVDRLVEEGAPVLSCAGGLMVEHPCVREHIEGIDGTEDSVMGLSKDLVLKLMTELKQRLDGELKR